MTYLDTLWIYLSINIIITAYDDYIIKKSDGGWEGLIDALDIGNVLGTEMIIFIFYVLGFFFAIPIKISEIFERI